MDLGVDVIYIINLEKDTYRRDRLVSLFKDHNITNYKFVSAIHGTELPSIPTMVKNKQIHTSFIDPNGNLTRNIYACALSHQLALKQFLSSKYETCLILEDDIMFTEEFYKFTYLHNLLDFTDNIKKSDYDVFFWGRQNDPRIGDKPTEWKYIYEPRLFTEYYSAHAYQVHRESAKKLLDFVTPVKYAADVAIELSNLKIRSPKYNLITQHRGKTDQVLLGDILKQIWEQNEVKELTSTTYEKVREGETRHNPCLEKGLGINYLKFTSLKAKNGTLLKDWVYIKVI